MKYNGNILFRVPWNCNSAIEISKTQKTSFFSRRIFQTSEKNAAVCLLLFVKDQCLAMENSFYRMDKQFSITFMVWPVEEWGSQGIFNSHIV
jgi:hypothetical protein